MEKEKSLTGGLGSRKVQVALSLVFGTAAAVSVYFYLAHAKSEVYAGMEMVEVVAASRSLQEGSVIDAGALKIERIPKKYVHRNAIRPQDRELIAGQAALNSIDKGQVLMWTDLGMTESQGGFSAIIREKERAISLPVDEVASVSGLIRPNDHVDIMGTFYSEAEKRASTVVILQNVTVLAAGRNYGKAGGQGGYSNVTVSVTPSEAGLLVHATANGKVTLALRNPSNIESASNLPKVTMEDIIKPEVRNVIQKDRDIRVIKGKQ